MRFKFVAFAVLFALSISGLTIAGGPAQADPYLWCAVYGDGNQNCVYKTLEQCRAAIEGGGACSPNLAYDRRDNGGLGRRHHALRY
jgi:hypothetical protein